ncbi:MAG: hypothetical protein IPL83_08435 [Bdellovibrionales bacterium]|nr:hypothetical protein [Bdellovibrionales bacterium]
MAEYVELVRQGPRSLKYELSRLVALVTVYGESMVLGACGECLGSGIIGVDNLELFLKRQHHPSNTNLNPEPIKFNSEKLNRVHPAVDLRRYDALYFEGENQVSAARMRKMETMNKLLAEGLSELKLKHWSQAIHQDLPKMKDQDRDLISKYLSQWISIEKSERHSSMIQSKIRTAKFRRVQTVENFDFRHSKTTEKVEKNLFGTPRGYCQR